MIRGTSVHMMA